MSWGFNEIVERDLVRLRISRRPPDTQGITFVAASGDDGTAAGPEYPASSPDVLAVGGTTLLPR